VNAAAHTYLRRMFEFCQHGAPQSLPTSHGGDLVIAGQVFVSLRLTAESACSGSIRCAICKSKREKTVTIRRLLKASRLAGLQEVEQRLNRAYRDVLRSLHLVDRNDPIAEIVAKTVIEIGATGVREPSEISKIALKRLAHLGRPRRGAPTGQEIFADF
jgi:hypothetical protein